MIVIAAPFRAGLELLPGSVVRRCQTCRAAVVIGTRAAQLEQDGARILCPDCAPGGLAWAG